MSVFHSDDCGETRHYTFRRIRTTTIRFKVQAERDAAIALSPDDEEEPEDMYEIFIGCWGGGASGIRRSKCEDLVQIDTPGILDGEEFREFWIKIEKGVIKVGIRGKKAPLMTYKDPELLLHITHYGYSTGWGAEGDWMFPDEAESDSSSSSSGASSSDSEAEELNNMEDRPIQYRRPARWLPANKGYFPHRPVSGGQGESGEVYVGMAHHEGGNILGMIVPDDGVCYIPFGGDAIEKENYYVLCNPQSVTLEWVGASNGKIPTGALEGGVTEDGEALYIGRVSVDGVVSCGKVHVSHGVCYVPYGGAEHKHRDYEVLCTKGISCKM